MTNLATGRHEPQHKTCVIINTYKEQRKEQSIINIATPTKICSVFFFSFLLLKLYIILGVCSRTRGNNRLAFLSAFLLYVQHRLVHALE